jgi:hypothetical protein
VRTREEKRKRKKERKKEREKREEKERKKVSWWPVSRGGAEAVRPRSVSLSP